MDSSFDSIQERLSNIESLLLNSAEVNGSPQLTYLTCEKAAKFLSMSSNALRVMVHKGQINYIKKLGKLFFRQSDLVDWFESGSVQANQIDAERLLLSSKKKGAKI